MGDDDDDDDEEKDDQLGSGSKSFSSFWFKKM